MKRCTKCGGTLKAARTEEVISLGEHQVLVRLPAKRCSSCGETYVAGEVAERADLLVASQLLDAGIASGEAFRFMRKALGLRAAELAELLGVDAATVSRWETGKVTVDRCALATLAAASSERLEGRNTTLDRLRAVQGGRRSSQVLCVDLAKAS